MKSVALLAVLFLNYSVALFAAEPTLVLDVWPGKSCRPDFAVLCYSGYLKDKEKDEIPATIRIPANTPPIFLAHTSDDKISIPENSVMMYLALQRARVPAELHIYASGNHDFGVRQNGKLPATWTGLCVNWLRAHQLLTPAAK
jgi:acetyl esterase/lipase